MGFWSPEFRRIVNCPRFVYFQRSEIVLEASLPGSKAVRSVRGDQYGKWARPFLPGLRVNQLVSHETSMKEMPVPLRQLLGKQIHPLGGLGGSSSSTLAVPIFTQQQSRWCWCACCAMVLDYTSTPKQQCDIASFGLGQAGCCSNPLPAACNGRIWIINPVQTDIIDVFANFGCTTTHLATSLTFASLRTEIDPPTSKPIEVCLAWAGGGTHVAVVRGYRLDPNGSQYVYINDPDPGRTSGLISFAALGSAYGLGSWTETFRF